MLKDGTWDVRCSDKIRNMFERSKPYYWKINKDQALELLKEFCNLYKIREPELKVISLSKKCNYVAIYYWDTEMIGMYSRNHIKSIAHEFYHHLDKCTRGKYNSDDRRGKENSLAWIFADKFWKSYTNKFLKKDKIKMENKNILHENILAGTNSVNDLLNEAKVLLKNYPNIYKLCEEIALDNGFRKEGPEKDSIVVSEFVTYLKKAEMFIKKLTKEELNTFAAGEYDESKALSKKYPGGKEADKVGEAYFDKELLVNGWS